MKKSFIIGVVLSFMLGSCENIEKKLSSNKKQEKASINLNYIDTTIRPQDDFFYFCNGKWLESTSIPSTESSWGSFNELDKSNKEKLKEILENASSTTSEKGSTEQLIGDYYASYMDSVSRNKKGIKPILPELNLVKELKSKDDLTKIITAHHKNGIGSVFSLGVGQDMKNVKSHTVYISQGGTGLSKDYYLEDIHKEIKNKYEKHIAKMLKLVGEKKVEEKAKSILAFEEELAQKHMSPSKLRIPELTYNKKIVSELENMNPSFDYKSYLSDLNYPKFDSIVIGQLDYFPLIEKMMNEKSLDEWKSYLLWKVIDHYAGMLNDEIVKANFDFYGTVLSGTKKMKPRWKRAISELTGSTIAEQLGKAFVEKHFSENAKKKVNKMVDNLMEVFEERLDQLEWMSEETKKQARHKLTSFGRKIGFPDKWKDFSSLSIVRDNYFANRKSCHEFSLKENIEKLNKPVDEDEWGMPAHMVNAYYHPLFNEIAFPAGIMQPPFFNENADDASNYGGIGMVIGHEFTHGFDDMGSKFAADGSFKNWWQKEDREKFEKRTAKLGATFESFCPFDQVCVQPDLTMGENIADLGGITLAYYAYKKTDEYKKNKKHLNYSPSQRFFIAFGQLWKIKYTDEAIKNQIATNPHSPGMYRVNGPLKNCPEFFEAFNVQNGEKMRNSKENIAIIW